MLQRLLMMVVFSLPAGFVLAQDSGAPVQGTDYFPIDPPQPTPSEYIEVVEVFGYSCPHCAHAAPVIAEWKKSMPADVRLEFLPAVFGGIWEAFARAYYAAETMGIAERSHDRVFEVIHGERRPIRNLEDIGALYTDYGVTSEAFVDAMTSMPVNSRISDAHRRVMGYGIEGTPTMVVAGKYRVVAPSGEDSFKRMMRTVDHLVAQERAARAK